MLPVAPSDREKLLYVHQDKFFLYSFGVTSTLLLVVGGTLFATHDWHFLWYLPFVAMVTAYLGVSYIIGIFSKPFDLAEHYDILRAGNWYKPSVDVYLPSAGEPLDVIENTFKHVAKLRWDPTKLCIYVLDDAGRPTVADMAKQYGFIYISRADRGVLKKAGNIRNAFKQTFGEIIAIFDADFCPRPDYLTELVPYMGAKSVALVQSPQYFRIDKRQSWIQRGSASIQELFYRLIQVNRNTWGASICVGSNAIYRRAALEPYGGTYPIQHSEDVHTGFNCVKDGWKLRYVPINLASGLCPDTLASFFVQQYRWCMGSTSLFVNKELFWGANLTLMQRICYLSGMFYYQATALGLIFTPLPALVMIWFAPEKVFWFNSVFSLPSFFFGTVYMSFWNRQFYGFAALRARFVSYYAHLFALHDRLRSTVMDWVPTGNAGVGAANVRYRRFRRLCLFWNTVPTLLGYVGAYRAMDGIHDYDFYPFLFLSTFYAALQLSCLIETKPKN